MTGAIPALSHRLRPLLAALCLGTASLVVSAPALARGPIVHVDGRVIGEHGGYARFTIGQRRGLPGGFADPLFVVAIRPVDRAVVVGPREALRRSTVEASSFTWVAGSAPPWGTECGAQLRAHGDPHRARIEAGDQDVVRVRFETPIDQAAPGQSLVLYRGDEVLGGGLIRRAA